MNTPSQYKSPIRYLSRDTNEYKSPVRYLRLLRNINLPLDI